MGSERPASIADKARPDLAALLAATTAASLPSQVRQHRDRAVALARELDPAAADWVTDVASSAGQPPTLVVLGETKRGKSSLVNALLAVHGLSPVDAEAATAAYLVFEHAATWGARLGSPAQPPEPLAVDDLRRWVSPTGELPAGQVPPRHIEVSGPVPLLRRLRIIDTPGVGGLATAPGELALDAAAQATAVLFVLDASAPFTRGELEFLRRAGSRVETVLFALTKTDQCRGWREVLAANRALLAEHLPRLADAPFHPVSARLAEHAAAEPNSQTAALLRTKSGIAELQTAVQQALAGRAALLAEANTLRALVTVFAQLDATLAAQQRALSAGAAEADLLRGRRDELIEKRRSAARGWQVRLRGEISKTRLAAAGEVTKQIRDLSAWFRREIDSAGREALAELPTQVDAGLQLVSQRVSAALGQRLNRVVETTLAELFSASELDLLRAQFARSGVPLVAIRPPEQRPPTAEDKLLVFMGLSSGLGLGRAAALPLAGLGVTALTPFVLPATIVVGLGAGWWLARTRKHTQDRQHLKAWLTDAIAEGRSTLEHVVSEQLIEAEQQLSLALDEAVARRIVAIEEELRAVDAALRLDGVDRDRRLASSGRRRAEVKSAAQRTAQLLDQLSALRTQA